MPRFCLGQGRQRGYLPSVLLVDVKGKCDRIRGCNVHSSRRNPSALKAFKIFEAHLIYFTLGLTLTNGV